MSLLLEILNVLFWFVVILIPLVVIHEFGHLIMARLNRVKVIEFGVGIPPRVVYKKWKGIIWSLNWVLLGGFAKIYGDHDALDEANEQAKINTVLAKKQYVENRLSELVLNKELQFFLEENGLEYDESWREFDTSGYVSSDELEFSSSDQEKYAAKQKTLETLIRWEYDNKLDSPEAFFNKALWQKILILLGGILFNLGTALIIFVLFYTAIGSPLQYVPLGSIAELEENFVVEPKGDELVVQQLVEEGAAYAAGVRPGDAVISVNGTNLNTLEDFDAFATVIEEARGREVALEYRSGETGDFERTELNLTEEGPTANFGVRSVAIGYPVVLRAKTFPQALRLANENVGLVLSENFKVVGRLLRAPFTGDREVASQVGGPVLVGKLGNEIYDLQGVKGILNAMALISVSLAAFNLLPLPALDGGRIVILLVNKLTGRRNKRVEGMVITVTMLGLLALGVLIAIKDVGLIG